MHVSDAALEGRDGTHLARIENTRSFVDADQVRTWCGTPGTTITVRPILDLNEHLSGTAYETPDRLVEQSALVDQTCVFPWCTRPARKCDVDHVIPYDHDAEAEGRPQPGPTETWNLAALCRHHHRLKTHGAWRYEMTSNGVFEWTSPHGHRFHRDRTGTTPIDPPPRRR